MATEEVDAVVLGTGPGGEDAAGRLAAAGLDVVAVESRLVGGECPYYACIPTKMMVRAAGALAEARRVPALAGSSEVRADFGPVADRISAEATTGWDDEAAVRRLESAGCRLLRGRGRITAPGEVAVALAEGGEQALRARRAIVLNPGTDPAVPPIDGLAGTPYWTNREAVAAREAPESVLVLGGGPVGLEFAQVFARFGSSVTVLEAGERILAPSEPEASETLTGVLRGEGIDVRTGAGLRRVHHDGRFRADLDTGEVLEAERLLVATGRRTDLAALGVDAVGLDPSAGTIPVDERLRAADGVWAIGDVTGHGAFTHTSVYQSPIAVADVLGREGPPADYRAMPAVTFTDPEVATVGRTEKSAAQQGIRLRTASTEIPSSPRGWIHKEGNAGLIKLVVDADRGVLAGATVVAPSGGEVVGALAVAVHAEVPVQQLQQMIYGYPTFHRAIGAALDGLA